MMKQGKKGFFAKLFGGGCNCGASELLEEVREEGTTSQEEKGAKPQKGESQPDGGSRSCGSGCCG